MQNLKEIRIPFAGFYETYHSETVYNRLIEDFIWDHAEQYPEMKSILEDYRDHDRLEWTPEADDHFNNWRYEDDRQLKYYQGYCEQYANRFVSEFESETGTTLDYDPGSVSLESPKFYNFTTDKIFIKVPEADLLTLLDHVDRAQLDETTKRMFTSRSGFISYYDSNIDDWGEPTTWDHNQWYAVITAAIDEDMIYNLELLHEFNPTN